MANLAAMKGAAPWATTVSCDVEVLQEIRELQVTPLTVQVWIWSKYKFKSMFLPHRNHRVFITKTICLTLFRNIVAAYCENFTNTNSLCGWNDFFFKLKQVVGRLRTALLWRVK